MAEEVKTWQIINNIKYMGKVYMVTITDANYWTIYRLITNLQIMSKVSIAIIYDFQDEQI